MLINFAEIPIRWINLDRHKKNAEQMRQQLEGLGNTQHERISCRESRARNVTGSTAHLDAIQSLMGKLPGMVLEDHTRLTDAFRGTIEVPDGIDAVYLGVTGGGSSRRAVDIGGGLARIRDMHGAHAVLYVSERFTKAALQMAGRAIEKRLPYEVAAAHLQRHFFVVAPHQAFLAPGKGKRQPVLAIEPADDAITNAQKTDGDFAPQRWQRAPHRIAQTLLDFGSDDGFAEWMGQAWMNDCHDTAFPTLRDAQDICQLDVYLTLVKRLAGIYLTSDLTNLIAELSQKHVEGEFLQFARELLHK